EGRLAARVFYLFDHGRELREIVEDLEVPPSVVRDLWHEWMIDLEDGEAERLKAAQGERRRRREEEELREFERRSEQEQKNVEGRMAGSKTAPAGNNKEPGRHPAGAVISPNGTPRSSSWTCRAPWRSFATERSRPRRASASKVDRLNGYTSDARTSSAA